MYQVACETIVAVINTANSAIEGVTPVDENHLNLETKVSARARLKRRRLVSSPDHAQKNGYYYYYYYSTVVRSRRSR